MNCRGFLGLLASSFLVAGTGCSLFNKLDVCDRPLPQAHVANVRTEGNQTANGQTPLAVLPSGGAFIAFASEVNGLTSRREIRATFLDTSGQRLPTCSQPNEVTFAEARDEAAIDWATSPSVAPPADGNSYGLIAFLRLRASDEELLGATTQVHAIPFDRFGCPVLDINEVRIDDTDERFSDLPAVFGLGKDRFGIIWRSHSPSGSDSRVQGRIIDTSQVIASFPATSPMGKPSGGEAVEILPLGPMYRGVAARALSHEQFAVTWVESSFSGRMTAHLGVFTDRLEMTHGPYLLNPDSPENGSASTDQPALDFDGTQFLVAWTAADERGNSRVYGQFVAMNGDLLGGPDGPGVFRLGTSEASVESRPVVVALDEGGFLTTWTASAGDVGGATGAQDIQAAIFDAEGQRAFTNPACGTEPFILNAATDGNQDRSFLAKYPDGSIAATWTDFGSNDINQRGTSSIVSTVYTKKTLFPIR